MVTLSKMAGMAAASFLGRVAGAGSTAPEVLSGTQATALLDTFGSAKGLVPLSAGRTANYLRADGTWAPPPGTGGSVALVHA